MALNNLSAVPSPYLSGYLDVPTGGMLMVEVSRWCPYSCSFCLYGRNMGSKLGNRYFGLERVLAEIRWGRDQGIKRIHFVEANLNLVPLFWPLMRALEDLNSDHQMTFYAELRGEHLTDEVVAALDRANVRYVEVGLQTANLAALKASLRRTDLRKWAAGTRRLYAHAIEVYLDVILGLPADDMAGVQETLDFIRREELGSYDVFTLQVLPGTAVRQQAQDYGLRFQERPPYYVLATDRLSYADLRRLRRELKQGANMPPDAVEGMPEPRRHALVRRDAPLGADGCIDQLWLLGPAPLPDAVRRLAAHIDVVLRAEDLAIYSPLLAAALNDNPSTIVDLYLDCEAAPPSRRRAAGVACGAAISAGLPRPRRRVSGWPARARLYTGQPALLPGAPLDLHRRVAQFAAVAEVIWRFELAEGDDCRSTPGTARAAAASACASCPIVPSTIAPWCGGAGALGAGDWAIGLVMETHSRTAGQVARPRRAARPHSRHNR